MAPRNGSVRRDDQMAHRSVFCDDWLTFRCVSGPRLSIRDTVGAARGLRRALQHYAADPVPEILSGHQPSGEPSVRPHAAIVALPTADTDQSPAELAGLAIIPPRDATIDERDRITAAVSAWEDAARRDDEDTPTLSLRLGALGVVALEIVRQPRPARTLRASTWSQPASRWVSVTPIVLDRYPGKLRSRDPAVAAKAVAEAERIIAASCRFIGLPPPGTVELTQKNPIHGVPPAREFPPYPGIAHRQTRYLVHAAVTFARPVHGPLLIGAGRHEGMGLMRSR